MKTFLLPLRGLAVLLSGLATIGLALMLRPVPLAEIGNCVEARGIVTSVGAGGGPADIVMTLRDDENYYYINRGLEQGVDLEQLGSELKGRAVTLHYVRHWAPLDPRSRTRHLARIATEAHIWYDEMTE